MPRIISKPDTLNNFNGDFEQQPLTKQLFLNSVPKCGSHLLKNIMRMFVPVEQQYGPDYIQFPTLREHHKVFKSVPPKLSWGHLLFADAPAMALKDVQHILLVRDPYDWVLARARFFLSDNFEGNVDHLKHGAVNIDDFLNMMIFGIYNRVPTLQEIFMNNAVSWMGTSAKVIHYEEIIKHVKTIDTDEAKTFFTALLGFGSIDLPDDWKERIAIGADRKNSGTARENLELKGQSVPSVLPDMQKRLVDIAAPDLRELLGYQ